MKKFAILLGYFDKQIDLIKRLHDEITPLDIKDYSTRYVFAFKTQQLYTAIEAMLKQIAKSFENHIENLDAYHNELLIRLNTEIPNVRPAVLSRGSFLFLDKVRSFRHFIRHAYDCELDEGELTIIKEKIIAELPTLLNELHTFRDFVEELSN